MQNIVEQSIAGGLPETNWSQDAEVAKFLIPFVAKDNMKLAGSPASFLTSAQEFVSDLLGGPDSQAYKIMSSLGVQTIGGPNSQGDGGYTNFGVLGGSGGAAGDFQDFHGTDDNQRFNLMGGGGVDSQNDIMGGQVIAKGRGFLVIRTSTGKQVTIQRKKHSFRRHTGGGFNFNTIMKMKMMKDMMK